MDRDLGFWIVTGYWVVSLALYGGKWVSAEWDRCTRYGKLAPRTLHTPWSVTYRWAFRSMYSWAVVESATLLDVLATRRGWQGACMENTGSSACLVPLGLFTLHALRRCYEGYRVHRYSERRMSVGLWLSGWSFYVMVPLTLARVGIECGQEEAPTHPASDSIGLWMGTLSLFVGGNMLQHAAHAQLAAARAADAKLAYHVLHGGLFACVACPHYLAEILIYLSLTLSCLLLRPRLISFLPVLLMLAFVALNLTHNAQRTRAWYLRAFPAGAFPPHRRALIPCLV